MPKNFQTSQYDEPIALRGSPRRRARGGSTYRVEIERVHLEEDTGKSLHIGGATGRIHGATTRSSTTTAPASRSSRSSPSRWWAPGSARPRSAKAYVSALRDLLRALDVSDVKMEQGSMRCDANVSLRPKVGDPLSAEQLAVPLGTRTETKNVNSLRSVERAVRYEISRHAALLDDGGSILQETRHWHEDTGITTAGRVKSDAEDYRYFPEPDLVPVAPTRETVEELRGTLPEPPGLRRKRLQSDWGYSDLEMRDVLNAGAVELHRGDGRCRRQRRGRQEVVAGEPSRRANADGQDIVTYAAGLGLTPAHIAELDGLVVSGRLNDSMARQVLDGVLAGEGTPSAVADARGLQLRSQDDGALEAAVDQVIAANPDVAARIRDGKVAAAGALIGQVMKQMKGQADAGKARELTSPSSH